MKNGNRIRIDFSAKVRQGTKEMICHKCGSQMEKQDGDLPFRIESHKIVIVKDIPAWICKGCGEIMLGDEVMTKVEKIIEKVRKMDAELEVVRYAA
jgi:YgiT-type zinc finger domain-containing protein